MRDHDERSLTGAVVPVPDPATMVGELVARVSGFGPLQGFLDDPTIEEKCTFPQRSRGMRHEHRPNIG
ncbi:MAG: hypothetical protein AB7I40_01510 [Nocardioides sp.]|uniref:hypothetical protein n=1 Tax=Nocardioides sp. TaxID=35761 RepID=UPI003D12AEF5